MAHLYFIRKSKEELATQAKRELMAQIKQNQPVVERVIERTIVERTEVHGEPVVVPEEQPTFVVEEQVFIPKSDLQADVSLAVETTTEDAGETKEGAAKLRGKKRKKTEDQPVEE